MPPVRSASASIHDPRLWGPIDRVFCGEHTWAILAGTTDNPGGQNEADVAAGIAEELVQRSEPPTLDVLHWALSEMGRAVTAWAEHPDHCRDLWSWSLGVVVLTNAGDAALIAHVGLARASKLIEERDTGPFTIERLTADHSLAERLHRSVPGWGPNWEDEVPPETEVRNKAPRPDETPFSILGRGRPDRLDFTRVQVSHGARIVLTSPGAHRGLEAPCGYLRELKTPEEIAQRICVEGRRRGGDRPRHASAIVIDFDPA